MFPDSAPVFHWSDSEQQKALPQTHSIGWTKLLQWVGTQSHNVYIFQRIRAQMIYF